jgi:heme/copper-type cytochrome/quinol oxidase subunit 2
LSGREPARAARDRHREEERMRSGWLKSFVVPVIVLAFAVAAAPAGDQAEQRGRSSAVPAKAVGPESVKKFHITASEGKIAPDTIRVKRGQMVKITFVSRDGKYGVKFKDFGVSTKVEPGKPATVQFVADQPGTFEFRCARTWNMKKWSGNGTLVVD